MFFVRLFIAMEILLMFASLFGIVAALENENILQMVISASFFLLSGCMISGSKINKKQGR